MSAAVGVTIGVINKAPYLNPNTYYESTHDSVITVDAPGLLDGASDPDGDTPLTLTITDNVDFGTLTVNADGSFEYAADPSASPSGSSMLNDSFDYKVTDSLGEDSNIVTVQLVIREYNVPFVSDKGGATPGATTGLVPQLQGQGNRYWATNQAGLASRSAIQLAGPYLSGAKPLSERC